MPGAYEEERIPAGLLTYGRVDLHPSSRFRGVYLYFLGEPNLINNWFSILKFVARLPRWNSHHDG